jgi:type IV secretory pathway TrbL component
MPPETARSGFSFLNNSFYFVCDLIIRMQGYFTGLAGTIAGICLLIALATAAINHAVNGQGIKDSLIKIAKALVFYFVIMSVYPSLVGTLTKWAFAWSKESLWDGKVEEYFKTKTVYIAELAEASAGTGGIGNGADYNTFGTTVMTDKKISNDKNPFDYFSNLLEERTSRTAGDGQSGGLSRPQITYSVIAPAAAVELITLVAGECWRLTTATTPGPLGWQVPDLRQILIGLLSMIFIIFTGVLCVLEYVLAFLEFMFVSSVGIILFPLSLWDGTKFMAEKYISAMIGFFLKLLFCNICIFLMLFGFMTLAAGYVENPFTGAIDEILSLVFTGLLFFIVCKNAPGMAQALLTGSPSLNAAGAISAAAGAVGAAAAAGGIAGGAVKAAASSGAKGVFNAAGAITQASSAAGAVKAAGGSAADQRTVFAQSMKQSAGEGVKAVGHSLSRSLLGGTESGGGGGEGGKAGDAGNTHSHRQQFITGNEGRTMREHFAGREAGGAELGEKYIQQKTAALAASAKDAAGIKLAGKTPGGTAPGAPSAAPAPKIGRVLSGNKPQNKEPAEQKRA